jgi:hypothetical protein
MLGSLSLAFVERQRGARRRAALLRATRNRIERPPAHSFSYS